MMKIIFLKILNSEYLSIKTFIFNSKLIVFQMIMKKQIKVLLVEDHLNTANEIESVLNKNGLPVEFLVVNQNKIIDVSTDIKFNLNSSVNGNASELGLNFRFTSPVFLNKGEVKSKGVQKYEL